MRRRCYRCWRPPASGKEVVVSRGELVEIGGAFRISDVMRLGRLHPTRSRDHQPHARE
ncbi:hypothetical protein ACNKHP_12370 [Shigella boydii]